MDENTIAAPRIGAATVRGKVLRDTGGGEGLLSVQGRQLRFDLETHWRGDSAPVVNQVVDVSLDADGALSAVRPVDIKQLTTEKAQDALGLAQREGGRLLNHTLQRVDKTTLIGVAVMLVGTTFFSLISVRLMGPQAVGASFYQVLSMLNGGNPQQMLAGGGGGAGIYALLWAAAVFGPLLPSFWSHRHASLAFFLPLLLWVVTGWGIYSAVRQMMEVSQGMAGMFGAGAGRGMNNMAREMVAGVWNSTTLGLGFYLSLAVTAFFTVKGVFALRGARRG